MIPISACANPSSKVRVYRNVLRVSAKLVIIASSLSVPCFVTHYNLFMRVSAPFFILIAAVAVFAQNARKTAALPEAKSVTVPITLDQNRVIIDVDVPLSNGSTQRARAWVDNGDPELWMSQRVAGLMGLSIHCDGQVCSAKSSSPAVSLEILIGGMKVLVPATGSIKVPSAAGAIEPGMTAEMKISSTVLRNYSIVVDFPERRFTIGAPGSVKFNGVSSKVVVNPENGLVQVPSKIENKKYNLALDIGSSISFLSEDLFDTLSVAHRDWPRMTGAVGPANMWGSADETKWNVMRVAHVQFGPVFLTDVAVVKSPAGWMAFFEKRAGVATGGLLGAEALLNYRVGLDYSHSTVYFEIGRTSNFPDFDVIGLVLRPEEDGRFTVLSVADYGGKPSVPQGSDGIQAGDHLVAVGDIPTSGATLGQVWSMLRGEAGQERRLTIERNGKQFTLIARVQHFLGDTSSENK